MARTVRDARLETRAARGRLLARQEPHWRLISEGAHLGYYKGKRGGRWVARFRRDGKAYVKTTLGRADDIDDANGDTVLSYVQAQNKARAWFEIERRADAEDLPVSGEYRISSAIDDYLDDYQRRGGKSVSDARVRADALIVPELGSVPVAKLTAKRLRTWHAGLADSPARLRTVKGKAQKYRVEEDGAEQSRRRRATANRTLTILKAALNHAWREGKAASDDAWRRVAPFREVDAARVRYLTLDEVMRLVNACTADLRPLVQAALFTGMRYGELASLTVADFNPDTGTVQVRQSKAGKARHVVLSDEGRAFFEGAAAGRPAGTLLFAKADGTLWARTHQQRPLREACRAAEIEPPASFHVLRHTYASHLVMNGAPLQVVATNMGHADTRMTEKHYAHLAPSYVASAIRAASPTLGIADTGKVKPLRRERAIS